jgi:hypothetical protein
MIHAWKKALLKGASGMFERSSKKVPEIDEEQMKELHAKIGELAVANDFCHDSSSLGAWSEVFYDREREFQAIDWQTVQAAVNLTVVVLLSAEGWDGAQPDADAQNWRTVLGNALLRCSPDDLASAQRWTSDQWKADQASDAVDGLHAIYQKPEISKPAKGYKIYPYLLKGLRVTRPNQVWASGITFIPMRKGFLYLIAIIEWHTRKVLTWRISNTLEADFCVEALNEAIAKYGTQEIINTDQGLQFT